MTMTAAAPPTSTDVMTTLQARGVVKRFGSLLAVDHVDLDIAAGVHALLGENGAGKSTLVRTLYGHPPADEGTITINGQPVTIETPAEARRYGIGLVFQQTTLIPAFSVAENVALFLPDLPPLLSPKTLSERIAKLSARYGLEVQPERRVGTLSLPEQQRVEIVRILLAGARILIFDEPTSTLPAHEIDSLFGVFRRLADDGYPIVFITHKLGEVLAVADRVTVMRNGAVVETVPAAGVTEDRLVQLMFGELAHRRDVHHSTATSADTAALELHGVCTTTGRPLTDVNLSVRPGELVGVAGISGNGQRELGDVIVGMIKPTRGERRILGHNTNRWSVRRIRDAGVGFIPENVGSTGVIWNMSLAENIALGNLPNVRRRHSLGIDWQKVQAEVDGPVRQLGLHLPDPTRKVVTLSGGNVQRFAVARELARAPKVLVALYPTRGLDVPTAAAVQDLLLDARDRGAAVLVISQDLHELMAIADRIVVLRDGRPVTDVVPTETDEYQIGLLMTGGETS